MKYLFWLWLVPMSLFWGWFSLSYYDVNFGTMIFSREIHDLVFGIYANILGVSYETIVTGFINACIFDTFLIFGIVAYRKRAQIKAWWQNRKCQQPELEEEAQVAPPMPAE